MFQGLFLWQDGKKDEYQSSPRNEQTCIAFANMLCVVVNLWCNHGNSNNLCHISNVMLENAISALFPRKLHYSKKNIKNTFHSNPWYV